MPEEQAFSVLVKIMFDYGLRELFKQNFEDLHCKFYQLERLMQVKKGCGESHAGRRKSGWRKSVSIDCLSHPGLKMGCLFFISHYMMMMPRLIKCEPHGLELGFQSHKHSKCQMTL